LIVVVVAVFVVALLFLFCSFAFVSLACSLCWVGDLPEKV
jgi:hypothetical protein